MSSQHKFIFFGKKLGLDNNVNKVQKSLKSSTSKTESTEAFTPLWKQEVRLIFKNHIGLCMYEDILYICYLFYLGN